MRSLRRATVWLIGLAALCIVVTAPIEAADQFREDAIKAAFLYRFTGYIEWPDSAPAPEQFTIAVIGGDAVAAELGKILPGHDIQGRPARVRQIQTLKEIGEARILYIGAQYTGDVRGLIARVPAHVLVVTDSGQGLDDGSAVNFMLVDRRVRFEISLDAAERAGLKVSSELLSVAARVLGVPQRSETHCEPRALGDEAGASCIPRLASIDV